MEMRTENSFGIIPLHKSNGHWEVLLVQHRLGRHLGFPKGHAIQGEHPQESAIRELLEETGLSVSKLLPEMVFHESYTFFAHGIKVHKTVTYFAAEVSGSLLLQEAEISMAKWVPLSQAPSMLSFPQAQEIAAALAFQFAKI